MRRDCVQAFALLACSVALKAKTGRLSVRDQLGFAIAALEWLPAQDAAQTAVVDFTNRFLVDPVDAGTRLQAFVSNWCEEVNPTRLEATLDEINAQGVFAWQQRADLK
ncbi:hypothetical protein [Planktotalea sp.]|uniref:hypothetical protein n=1 Tax=Planktotalea sp. TaxID=2029877 RepID=UPI003D6A86A3